MTTLSQRSVRSRPSAIMFIFSIALRGVPRLDGRSTTNRTTRNPLEQPHRALLVKDMSARQQHRPLRLAKLRHADGALVNAYADAAEFLLDLALARHPARVALHQPDGERGELGGGRRSVWQDRGIPDGGERFEVRTVALELCYEQVEVG